MEYLDEYESRPRFLLQSKHYPPSPDRGPDSSNPPPFSLSSLHRPSLFVSVSISLLLLTLAFLYFNFEPLKSLLLWLALSLLLGPFAPPSLTAGDVRVGLGPPLKEETPIEPIESTEKLARKSTKSRKKVSDDAEGFSEKSTVIDRSFVDSSLNESNRWKQSSNKENKSSVERHEDPSEWSEADDELLRKLMGKHPVGKPGRWEAIAEGFKGSYKVDTIISKAKEMGDRKVSDQDSFKKFLKDRKAVDKRVVVLDEGGGNEVNQNVDSAVGKKESGWSSAEDLALLTALKTFQKDEAMRWEKIAAAVPGKTKAGCIKRVTELKKDFRSSKASTGQA